MLKSFIVSVVGLFVGLANCSAQDFLVSFKPFDQYQNTIRPLLKRYCNECHAPGGKDVEFLWPKTEAEATKLPNSFASVLQRLEDGTMPPADTNQPTDAERKIIRDWISKTFDLKAADFDQLSSYVVETFEDKTGNLWFGTVSDGAARYDGKTLTWFSTKNGLGGDTVASIAEDKHGHIWLGTDGGASKFDGKAFTTYSTAAGLPGTRCYVLVDRNGTVWVGTEKGVFRFDGTKFSKFDIPVPEIKDPSWKVSSGKVWCLIEDRKGNLWFGRDSWGACRFDGKAFTHFTVEDGLCSNNVSCIVEDKEGNIWLGCLSSDHPTSINGGGLNRFDGTSFAKFPETEGLFANDIYTILATKRGDVWIGATGVGAYRYDGSTFNLIDKTDKPYWTRYFGIQSMLEDRRGTLWFGFSGGLFRFNGESFFNIGKDGPWGNTVLPEQKTEKPTSIRQNAEPILDAPQGWGVEQILFPLSFAPSIKFNGYEDIRFAPGWSKSESEEFWSYKFVWQIDEDPQLNEERLGEMMETYFDGLSRAVGKGSEQNIDTLSRPVAVFVREADSYKGRLKIYDAFSSQDWISLNARIHIAKRGAKHLVVVELSPKPFAHAVWESLEKIKVTAPRETAPAIGN